MACHRSTFAAQVLILLHAGTRAAAQAPASGAAFLRRGTQEVPRAFGAVRPVVLPLSRRLAQVGAEVANGTAPMLKSFYVGSLRVGGSGAEQEMEVFFDTSSGQVILDSTRCEAAPCLQHHRYAPKVDLRSDGTPVPEGRRGAWVDIHLDSNDAEPGTVTGDLVRDRLCLSEACAEVNLVAATNLSDRPFLNVPFDGIVGLGLESLSIGASFSFAGRLANATGLPAQFAFFAPASGSGEAAEIAFGGYSEARLATPLSWVPVVRPQEGFWQLRISSIRVGERSLDLCERFAEGCRGIVDSSSANLGVPSELMAAFQQALAVSAPEGLPCSEAVGPELHLLLEGGTTLTLGPSDYAGPATGGTGCEPQLHPVSPESKAAAGRFLHSGAVTRGGGLAARTLLLGEPLLRRYYTVFDFGAQAMGFGLAARSASAEPRAPEGAAGPAAVDPDEQPLQEEFILLQTCRAEAATP